MHNQDAMPFLCNILLKKFGGRISRFGKSSATQSNYRDHQKEIDVLSHAFCMTNIETIEVLVYLRTVIHNLIYSALIEKTSVFDYGNLQSLKYMAVWLDGNIDVFLSLPDAVVERKDIMVPVMKPSFLSDRLKERVEHGFQKSCKINSPVSSLKKEGAALSTSNVSVQHSPVVQKRNQSPAKLQMMQMGDDLCSIPRNALTMAAPGSRLIGSSQQMQWG